MTTENYLDQFQMVSTCMFSENRQKVLSGLKLKGIETGFALFQGGSNTQIYDTDCEYLFRQESTFQYLFGVNEPGFYGGIDIASGLSYLFIPRLDPSYAVWQGHIKTTNEYKDQYQIDNVFYVDEIATILLDEELYVMSGVNKISGGALKDVTFSGIESFKLNNNVLYNIVCDCRAIKSERELNLLRFINNISVEAHTYVMQQVKNCRREKDLEAEFLYYIERVYGCRYVSYTCVCCTGKNSAILHYGHAGAPLADKIKSNDILLLDMGAEYFGYDSDITCSFPATGQFNTEQRLIYQAVLDTQRTVESNIKAGVSWATIQRICEIEIVKHLSKIGIILPNDKTPEELVNLGISKIFFPHSFGHYMGLDVHDVREGYPQYDTNVENPTSRNVLLKAGMVITNEPGIYFIESLITSALADNVQSLYLNQELLNNYINFGGIRLEDDIIVLDNGCENMTISNGVCREIEDIENVMSKDPVNLPVMCKTCSN